MSRLLIATKVVEFIAVADDRFPCVFVQSPKLCHVLDDDRDEDLSGSHRRKQLIKLIRKGNVRKLIHQEMDWYR